MTPPRRSAVLDLPDLPDDDRLHGVLRAALDATGRTGAPTAPRADQWDAAYLGLDRTTAWKGATDAQRRTLLTVVGRSLLEEAYYVEKCGLAYAAKRVLQSRSTEERALYALFAADEARHLDLVSGWLAGDDIGAPSAFHRLLEDVLERADPVGAVLIVQVLLEGWGLRHYADLARACRDADLGALLRGIVKDETRHHGSGVLLTHGATLSPEAREITLDLLRSFLDMVRVGPVGVLAAVEHVVGPLSRDDRLTTLRELDGEAHAASRLAVLHGLLDLRVAADVRRVLEGEGRFTPFPMEAVA
jgi:hypothetical protein